DGGETWYREYFDRNLPDPVCEGSLLNVNRRVIAFCNNADTSGRNNLTLRLSTNRGESWFQKTLIYSNDKVNDASGYSDIVNVNDRTIGVLYEKDNYSSIVFTTVEWSIPVYKALPKKKSHVVKKSNRKRR
ncbi:MAG TPA: sialidase family protein, partial [Saprospiraceae bacterium]|nr:sialidase family protein [Saprospiraceae bacterium]